MRITFGQQQGMFAQFPQAGSMDAFARALEARRRSVAIGFDASTGWDKPAGILKHLESEVAEFRHAVEHESPARQADEMGDVLYVATQVASASGIDPKLALENATDKFVTRQNAMADEAQTRWENRPLTELSLPDWRTLWKAVKIRLEGRPTE